MLFKGQLAGLTLALLLGGNPPLAIAQVSQLDPATFVDGLANEGMGQLLRHLVDTEPSDDPVVDRQIRIAQHRMQSVDRSLDQPARLAALDQAIQGMRQLITDFYDHEQRPLWQTDLAQWLLFTGLQDLHHNAWGFYTFGVPTPVQQQAYQQAVVEALKVTRQADLRFFQLQGLLPRQAHHITERVNTGLWTRMIDVYWKKRTAYLLALAGVSTAQLPDDADYFQTLGRNDKMPNQAATIQAERKRLAQGALEKLEPFLEDLSDQAGLRDRARVLAGLAYNLLGQPEQALKQLNPVIEAAAGDMTDLNAHLARAQTQQLLKQTALALEDLRRQLDHPQARGHVMNRLLVVDQMFRLLQAQAKTADQLAQAYAVYRELLNDSALGDDAALLRDYIYTRWSDNLDLNPETDLAGLPAIVRMAIGQVTRIQAQQALDAGDTRLAQEKFQRAIRVNESLLVGSVEDAVLAQAKFNLALALYDMDPADVSNLMRVAELLINVADTMPDQPVADDAMTLGIDLLRSLYQATPRPAGADEAYRHGASVLFGRYPLTEAADNERLYYGYAIEQLSGHYQKAIAQYQHVPEGHAAYFDAQRERLFSMAALSQAGELPWDQTVQAAHQVRRQARGALPGHAHSATSALAGASLVLADAADAAGQKEQALEALADFEERFADHRDLVRLGYEKRLALLVSVGQHDQAAQQARAMMSAFPDEAAAVIDQVLTQLDSDMARLRLLAAKSLVAKEKEQYDDQAKTLAKVAAQLADVLTQWAQAQGFDAEQMLAFELIQNKSLRLSGQTDQALAVAGRLIQTFPDDAAVISAYADTLFAIGDRASLMGAMPYYDQLINGLAPPYPDLWWNAWLKRLTLNDQLGQGTQDIALRIGQLKRTDPNLGGAGFKRAFDQLQAKYSH